MWTAINNKTDLASLPAKTLIRRLPDEDDHVKAPPEYVVIINDINNEILRLSIPILLQQWLKANYYENYNVGAMDKTYDSFIERGTWEWYDEKQ